MSASTPVALEVPAMSGPQQAPNVLPEPQGQAALDSESGFWSVIDMPETLPVLEFWSSLEVCLPFSWFGSRPLHKLGGRAAPPLSVRRGAGGAPALPANGRVRLGLPTVTPSKS